MSVTAQALILTKYAPNSAATQYTAPGSTRTIIDKFTGTNVTGSAVALTVYIVTNGNSVGNEYKLLDAYSIPANTAYDVDIMKNHILESGDFISVFASSLSAVVIRASGREIA